MASIEGLRLRPFAVADIEAACALNAEAGWNQVAADWRYMAEVGQGVAVETADGELIATGMLQPFGSRFAWIAMILVAPSWQRRGVASMIMRHCLEDCARLGVVAGLDATEQGHPVYLPLGFQDVYSLSRLAVEQSRPHPVPMLGGVELRSMTAADVVDISAFDAAVFGADRSRMLSHLHGRCPELALLALRDDTPAGYVLARDGRLATQIGPLVAEDEGLAQVLLNAVLERIEGPVFLDLADRHEALRQQLRSAGFQRQRGYVRMLLGRAEPLDDPARSFIITGPEFA